MTDAAPVLNTEISAWLERIAELVGSTDSRAQEDPLDAAIAERTEARRLSDLLFEEFGEPDPGDVERRTHLVDTSRGKLRIDEYRPVDGAAGRTPAYLLLHGGAFRLGSIDERINVAFCTRRARDSGSSVYSVEYRLAPENPFPAALDDARSALEWISGNADDLNLRSDRVVVGGVSAGASVAASLALDCRDRGSREIMALLLEVPVVDVRDDGLWLPEYAALNGFSTLADLRGGYCVDRSPEDPAVSQLLADLGGLPPVHVMTAEYDPLRAGGEVFVERLREAGNSVSATRHLGQLHGSHGLLRDLRAARLWHAEVAAVLRDFAR